jgi:hypothetical protein
MLDWLRTPLQRSAALRGAVMATRFFPAAARSLAGVTLVASLLPAAAFPQAASDAAAVAIFTSRTEEYVRLRARLEEPLPVIDERRGSRPAMLTRRYLAAAIRAARPRAVLGAIFAPPVDRLFRDRLASRVTEADVEGLSGWDEDLGVDIVVHEPVPAWSRLEVPAILREPLPALPSGIDYRMVNGALVLWDLHAEIVIDALPAAFIGR